MWQELRTELYPKGLEIVTIALDTAGVEAGPAIEAAKPEHPSLIDQAHTVDELFGIVNVPSGVWINEEGMIVRPAEPAWATEHAYDKLPIPADATKEQIDAITEGRKLLTEADRYIGALRDWVDRGSASHFALDPEEVVRRSAPRPMDVSLAAANFEMGQHLHRAGHSDDAVDYFREAHLLQPDNWTYKRQAWKLVDPGQRADEVYEGNFLKDLKEQGGENFYPALDM